MQFRYRGRDSAGRVKAGALDAADRGAAFAQLSQGGLSVSELRAVGGAINLNAEIHFSRASRKVTPADLALFCDQFATLLDAGVPILRALQVLAGQFRGRKLGAIILEVVAVIEGGDSLSQALRQHREHLPATMVYMTAVAETAGRLAEAYALLSRQFEAEEKLVRKVKSALTYPLVVVTLALVVVVFMLTFVLPTYSTMFQEMGATLPASTRVLMAVGDGLRAYWFLVPPLVGGCWFGAGRVPRQERAAAAVDRLLVRLPLVGALRYKRELGQFCRTLATMSRSGVPLMAALLTVGEATERGPLKRAIASVQERVADGDTFGDALRAQTAFDRISVEMIALGEQAGTLETMLFKVADIADRDVNLLLERLTALLEPLMTLLIGALVVGIIVPMILPMFDILGQVQ